GITMELVEELDETTRGEGGFGSTDQKSCKTVEKQDPPIKRSKVVGEVASAARESEVIREAFRSDMGKKGGKKKEKITGTPDVVRFKTTTTYYATLRECAQLQESLPFVASDPMAEDEYKKVARFLSMLGMLCDMCEVQSDKGYRTRNYHKLLDPRPNFDPKGFPVAVVQAARGIQDEPSLCYNGKRYQFSDEVKEKAESFLKDIDREMNLIAGYIEPALKSDFGQGLRTFKVELTDKLMEFDEMFVEFEQIYS
ncbi:hypothetical protein FOZ63_009011, partial [Perkinsus olseni]